MKYIKQLSIFEDAQKKADLKIKDRDLGAKLSDLKSKGTEAATKMRDEEDPFKSELLSLQLQKIQAQAAVTKIDIKINKVKIRIEDNK